MCESDAFLATVFLQVRPPLTVPCVTAAVTQKACNMSRLLAEDAAGARDAAAHVHRQGAAVRSALEHATRHVTQPLTVGCRFQLIKEMRTVEVMPSEQELQKVGGVVPRCSSSPALA